MKKLLPIILIVIVIGGGAAVLLSKKKSTPTTTNTSSVSTGTRGPKLSDSQYAGVSYLISGSTMAADAKAALAGFLVTQESLANGDRTFTLTAQKSGYTNQQYTLKPGQQLYFVETSMGDDADTFDGNLGDDTAIVVDADGYIVQ